MKNNEQDVIESLHDLSANLKHRYACEESGLIIEEAIEEIVRLRNMKRKCDICGITEKTCGLSHVNVSYGDKEFCYCAQCMNAVNRDKEFQGASSKEKYYYKELTYGDNGVKLYCPYRVDKKFINSVACRSCDYYLGTNELKCCVLCSCQDERI